MNLGQTLMVIAALGLLGLLVLNSNRTVLETNDVQSNSEYGIAAVSLATSLVEEADGKMFDEVIADSTTATLTDPSQLSAYGFFHDTGERYRAGALDFDDFDDFDNLKIVFKDKLKDTSAVTVPADSIISVPGLRAAYYVTCAVVYVNPNNLNATSAVRTWHKKLTVTVTILDAPSFKDTLRYPTIMSFWN
jgi:hypothetical protein